MKPQFLCTFLLVLVLACTGGGPGILGVADQTGYVGRELVIELRAVDVPAGENPTFGFSTAADGINESAVIELAGIRGAAIFRWTPRADDLGTWVVDFEVRSRGVTAIETVTIEVQATSDGEPVFRRPLGAGVTYDPSEGKCLEVPIVVDDPDSASVTIHQEGEVLDGATIEKTGDSTAIWKWCPPAEDFVLPARHVIEFVADDGVHAPVSKPYIIVVRPDAGNETVDLSGWLVTDPTTPCFFQFPAGSVAFRNATVVLARNATQQEFEEFWGGKKLAPETLFINTHGGCPRIAGGERFSLHSSAGEQVDGPTPPILDGGNLQRKTTGGPPGRFGSWSLGAATEALPGEIVEAEVTGGIYISEVSDAVGDTSFQFIELAVD